MKELLTALAMVMSLTVLAQPGTLDSSFGTDGIVTTSIGAENDQAYAVAVQDDGKIILGGSSYVGSVSDFTMVRYNADGSLDQNFGNGGKVITTFSPNAFSVIRALTILPDGKILAAGQTPDQGNYHITVVRYKEDGSLDAGFATGGKQVHNIASVSDSYVNGMAVQDDGKIVVGGYVSGFDFMLARFNENGSVDAGFGSNGSFITEVGDGIALGSDVALQSDGKILLAGRAINVAVNNFALIRCNTDGTLDAGFGDAGQVMMPISTGFEEAKKVIVQPDGKILLVGHAEAGSGFEFAIMRLKADGTLDNSFGNSGSALVSFGTPDAFATAVVLQSDGKMVVAGYTGSSNTTWKFALARLNADGTLDQGFGIGGKLTTAVGTTFDYCQAVAMQPDGKIVAAGYSDSGANFDFAAARYLSGLNVGIVDFSISENSVLIYPNPVNQNSIFKYTLTSTERITIDLVDINGKRLQRFVDQEWKEAGPHQQPVRISEEIPSGNYFLILSNSKGQVAIKIFK
ncbi:MAG: T9SS type A sorting domain-containing protein [Bacteroidia bacterium]